MQVTQAFSHFNYSLSSGPTTHCTVVIIYVEYNVFCFSLWLHCDVIRNFNEHTNALTVIYLLIYLFFTCRIFLVICTMHCFIYFTLWCTSLTAFWYRIPNLYVIYLFLRLLSNAYGHFLASCFCSSLNENIVILRYITRWSNFTFYFYLNYFWKVILLFTWVIFSTL